MSESKSVKEFFHGHPLGLQVFESLQRVVEGLGPCEVRVSRTQVALRRRRSFAFIWQPGRWLKNPTAELVVSISLNHQVLSPRFKEVVHPSKRTWMHHMEVHAPEDIDDEVVSWLRQAYADAA